MRLDAEAGLIWIVADGEVEMAAALRMQLMHGALDDEPPDADPQPVAAGVAETHHGEARPVGDAEQRRHDLIARHQSGQHRRPILEPAGDESCVEAVIALLVDNIFVAHLFEPVALLLAHDLEHALGSPGIVDPAEPRGAFRLE